MKLVFHSVIIEKHVLVLFSPNTNWHVFVLETFIGVERSFSDV